MRSIAAGLLSLALLSSSGCATQIGPRMVPQSRMNYGDALVRSADQQLLLNLVRLRYRDHPLFLDVGSVVTHFSTTAGASVGATLGEGGSSEGTLGGSVSYGEEPTVTWTPLQGKEFVTRLLTPISPTTMVLLTQSGWSVERLLLCCVQSVNSVPNAVAAAGPTPDYVPEYEEFQELASGLRRLQRGGLLGLDTDEEGRLLLEIRQAESDSLDQVRAKVFHTLHLDPSLRMLRITPRLAQREGDELALQGRSLLAVMFFLSHGIEIPQADAAAGKVTVTRTDDGRVFDWSTILGSLIRVRTSETRPGDAAVCVSYRGHFFFIADDDLNSKSTFNLLAYLFSLQAGGGELRSPLLTIGVP